MGEMEAVVTVFMFVVLFMGGMFIGARGTNNAKVLCAYSTGYMDAELKYLHTTNLTAAEQAAVIYGNSTRTAFLGMLACDEIGIGGTSE